MRDLNRIIRCLAYTLELLVLFMIQETPGLLPRIYGARPVLVLAAGLVIAMFELETPAMAFGIVAGLFCDFGFSGTLGFHALILAVLCFFISLLVRAYMQVNPVTAVLLGIVALGITFGAQWLFFYYFRHYSQPLFALTSHYLPKYLYTLLFVPLLYLVNKGLSEALPVQEK
ncbi:rod shape-determining protein MreD [Acutalibacter sp. 1XD8-33]|uniref:rod shape-determining protein MreD n=1 Tax=Acutalibacter sp. 1XD8-33 TaxID=2320081 RepID=UPI000EA00493|nr:rod shape-determining protein MreD [Acutalibacter sp. 1XD8-33]RKJ40265.1 rod shape-determining protein MreD [Acutalibacter sp. 1XD8-33]